MIIFRPKIYSIPDDGLTFASKVSRGISDGVRQFNRDWFLGKDYEPNPKNFKKGDIVIADRGVYNHYGVVVSNKGDVIDFGPRNYVAKRTIQDFSHGDRLSVEKPSGRYTPDQIAARAEAALRDTRGKYNVRTSNCEHFAREIVNGTSYSKQVRDAEHNFKNESLLHNLKNLTPTREDFRDIFKNNLF